MTNQKMNKMKNIDITKEIPELTGLIEISQRIEQMEALLETAKQAQDNIVSVVLEKIFTYEQTNKLWFGEEITIEYKQQNFLIKGLNDDPNDTVRAIPLEYRLVINDKQTKGNEREKV